MIILNRLLVGFLLLVVCSSAVFAAPSKPSTSGTYSTGQTVTISGSSFGTKSPAAPILWAPFDSSKTPSSLGRVTTWHVDECIDWTSSGGRSGGGVKTNDSCIAWWRANLGINTETAGISYAVNTFNQKTYIFRHRKMLPYTTGTVWCERTNSNITNTDCNLKSMEFIGTDYSTNANWVFNHTVSQWVSQHINPDSSFYLDSSPVGNQWATEELILQAASTSTGNANLKWYANGTLLGDSLAGENFIASGPNATVDLMRRITPVYHGDYNIGADNMGQTPEYWDSVYVDNTWSRVVIGNASTYSSCTQREIQIPTAWGTSSISVSFNQGAFANGSTVYLYVVDSGGNVSPASDPITIAGSGGDTTAPVRSAGSPTGSLAAGTTSTTMSLTTDEAATCKFSTSAGTAYASMTNTFTTTGGTSHSVTVSELSDGGSYSRHVRCADDESTPNVNTDDYTISWTVSTPGSAVSLGTVLLGR